MKLRQLNVAVVVGMGLMQQRITTQHAECSVFAQPDCQSIPTTKTPKKIIKESGNFKLPKSNSMAEDQEGGGVGGLQAASEHVGRFS